MIINKGGNAMKMRKILVTIVICLFVFVNGCAVVFQKGRTSDKERIRALERELADLRSTRELLEDRLSSEIDSNMVSLKMQDKGLVITFLAEVLFDSGKAKLRESSDAVLTKVSNILIRKVPNNNIGVEGHTDNVPIKYSKWQSNWELSTQRALSVLHFLEDHGVNPERLSVLGYGQYAPVASNDTEQGRQLNRRVEIVIVPKMTKTVKRGTSVGRSSYRRGLK